MQSQKISIITPTFNRKHLIEPLIESVLNQTFNNWELLIIDDHSTDGTVNYLKEKYKKVQQIRTELRESPIKGANSCRNQGIRNSTGNYIMFLDSDDLLFNNCLMQRSSMLTGNSNADFLVFNGVFGNKNGESSNLLWNVENEESDLIRFIKSDSVWSISGGIFKKDFLNDKQLFFDEQLNRHQDVDFHIQVLLNKPRYQKHLELKPDYIVRRHGNESTSQEKNADFSIPGSYIANKIFSSKESLTLLEKRIAIIKLEFEINHLFLRKHYKLAFHYLNNSEIPLIKKNGILTFWLYSTFTLKILKKYPKRTFGIQLWQALIQFEQSKSSIGKHKTMTNDVN